MTIETKIKDNIALDEKTSLDRQTRSKNNRYKNLSGSDVNLTGSGHTVVAVLHEDSTISDSDVSALTSTASVTKWNDKDISTEFENLRALIMNVCARGWGTFPMCTFTATSDAIQIDLGSGEDWTSDSNDDNLLFWVWSDRTTEATDFDLELIASDGSTIKSNNNLPVITQGRWNLINLDVSSDTLDDVQYIKIIMDGSNATKLFICDFVRTLAATLTNDVTIDLQLDTNLGTFGNFISLDVRGIGTETGKLYINSLANDGITFTGNEILKLDDFAPIFYIFVNGVTSDTTANYDIYVEGELL